MPFRPLTVIASALLIFLSLISWSRAQDLPGYKFAPGQQLQYESTSDSTYPNGAFRDESSFTAWVVRHNDNGSWRIIIQSTSKFSQIAQGKTAAEHSNTQLDWIDLAPDGRSMRPRRDTFSTGAEPALIFPALPPDAASLAKGWQQDTRFATMLYTSAPSQTPGEFVFRAEQQSPENSIYEISNTATLHFDVSRGLLDKSESQTSQGYGFTSKGHGTTLLKDVSTRPADWISKLDQESQVFFTATEQYQHQTEAAENDPKHWESILKEAEQTLHTARPKLTLPVLTGLLDEQISNHSRTVEYMARQMQQMAAVLDKPAADWTLKDLAGQTHSLADYRGKVVLLDFWYHGCGWCMRAMPQMKEVASDFKSEPVAVIGMNIDRNEKDAQFVVDKMGLNYLTLRAHQSLPEKYGVRGYPTLVIIDPQGVVRRIHVGYAPNLRQKLNQSVRELLKTSGTEASAAGVRS